MAFNPPIFVSHGPPGIVISDNPAANFLRELGSRLPRPEAIVCVSAHWEASWPMVSGADKPDTIHDFGGPPSLFKLSYPCPGAPRLAENIQERLSESGLKTVVDSTRGLDHGAWTPLMLMYPHADIPVVQLSVQTELTPEHHFELGQVLAPLKKQGVLIMGSGGATHNLDEIHQYKIDSPPPGYAQQFDQWLKRSITQGDTQDILDYKSNAPDADRNHPYPAEHFLPLFVPLGAAGKGAKGRALYQGFMYGVLSMAAYIWD